LEGAWGRLARQMRRGEGTERKLCLFVNLCVGATNDDLNRHAAQRGVVGGFFDDGADGRGRKVLGIAPAGKILAGGFGATAATHRNPQVYLEIVERLGSVLYGLDDLALGYSATYTNKHENNYYLDM